MFSSVQLRRSVRAVTDRTLNLRRRGYGCDSQSGH